MMIENKDESKPTEEEAKEDKKTKKYRKKRC